MESRDGPNKPANRGKVPKLPGELRRRSGRDEVVRTGLAAVVPAVRPKGIHERAGGIREDDAEGMLKTLK